TRIEFFRSFRWYANELKSVNCQILDYNSFNLLTIDRMPRKMLCFLQRLELRHHSDPLLRVPFLRRHGAELKIKARVMDRDFEPGHSETASIPPQALGHTA